MMQECKLRDTILRTAEQNLPTVSSGQLDAIEQFAAIVRDHMDQPVTIRLMEAVGGAGKSQLITSLTPVLQELGIAVVRDEQDIDEFRRESGHSGPIVATGRMFGERHEGDITVNVVGFSSEEIQRILAGSVPDKTTCRDISRYSIGSLRLAQIMAEQASHISEGAERYLTHTYFARIAASFLYDRIPDYMLQQNPDEIQKILEHMYRVYVPDQDVTHEMNMIAHELFDLSHYGFARLNQTFELLGSNPNNRRGVNPIDKIVAFIHQGGRKYVYPPFMTDVVQRVENVRKKLQASRLMSVVDHPVLFPLATSDQTYQILKQVITGSVDGAYGVHREPRISLVAAVPQTGAQRTILEQCLKVCIDYPIRTAMRKTALAIFPPNDKEGVRISSYGIFHDDQFYTFEHGVEKHKFFHRPFPALETTLHSLSDYPDTLCFVSGDHTKIPRVPTILTDLILESILQQLGYPYVVQYIHTRFAYDPNTQTLQPV